ncbi:DUF943 family protein [Mixta calida]|uniref:DUF943 domain-containing protein n=3 Tax=Mixta calida TaxID=665913 RepID=A0ABN5HGI9_9GAMM|nr:DUF943 family protein [Mixta calida]AUY26122.1 DUF943 domain-containing protein [Mixta calida]POU50233.1 DUF943 domain-containing protein [Pantoea sp. PSNIH5]POU69056.1 DUF943 domain-containing protein [Pantoea sp. PSNIH4]POY68772.1 DUF943 domain-containing protein [Pantoea sp. PSNIH3]
MKKYRYLFIFSLLLFFFRLLLPVKIIGVHKLGETSTIVIVKNFPLTRMGKISWWQQHQSELHRKWPFIGSVKNHRILFFQADYQKDSGTDQDSDLLCFEEMATEQNCISKENRPLIIRRYPDGHIEYETESILRRFY